MAENLGLIFHIQTLLNNSGEFEVWSNVGIEDLQRNSRTRHLNKDPIPITMRLVLSRLFYRSVFVDTRVPNEHLP